MIPFDFDYYRPDSVSEAVDLFFRLAAQGKKPVYYGGGSELISMARVGNVTFGAVIDIKAIPECRVMEMNDDRLLLGSALTLSEITEANLFPLLTKAAGRVADHTMQCKITLGGNIAGTIIYRECVLPLLLTDVRLVTAGPNGMVDYEISRVFNQRLKLQRGELLLRAEIPRSFLQTPYFHVKKTKSEKIDYPLITAVGLKKDGAVRMAFSGLAAYPFRDLSAEGILNDAILSFEQRANAISGVLDDRILQDHSGSKEFRKFVLKNTVLTILETMKEQA